MKTMKNMKTNFVSLFITCSLLSFLALSCEQPFKAGLGPVIDIRPPSVTLERPGAGAYISGIERILLGNAEDDYIIDYVEFKVTNQPALADRLEFCEGIGTGGYQDGWVRADLRKASQNKGEWSYVIDTTMFPDGDLKIKLKAWDSVGKWTETGEIILLIRNDLPKIKLTVPRVDENRGNVRPGDINDYPHTRLNYSEYWDENGVVAGTNPIRDNVPSGSVYPRFVSEGSFISGSVTYDQGLNIDSRTNNPEYGERYYPQIRIWEVVDIPDNTGNNPYRQYKMGVFPPLSEVPWRNIEDEAVGGEVIPIGANSATGRVSNIIFAYPVPPAGSFYGFEIRVQSADPRGEDEDEGLVSFRYPRDFWPSIGRDGEWDERESTDDFITENRYVFMYVQSLGMAPSAALWNLQDFLKGGYTSPDYADLAGVDDNDTSKYHPYINRAGLLNKNTAFTLRIKASHPQGINAAEVYWELDHNSKVDGKPLRGRFIWDSAVYDSSIISTPATAANGVALTESYDMWGFKDRYDNRTRNFIFTYDEANNITTVPAGAGYGMAGRAKIQIYRGAEDWNSIKKSGSSPKLNPNYWVDVQNISTYTLEDMEGTYSLEVYVRQNGNNGPLNNPHLTSAQFRVDWTKPTVQITNTRGTVASNLSPTGSNPKTATANGVVEFNLLFDDSGSQMKRAAATGSPPDSDYYGAYERMYLLVDSGNATVVDALLNSSNPNARWPTKPAASDNGYNSGVNTSIISGANVRRHGGAGSASTFRIKTSGVLSGDTATPTILNDGTYWLYVLARDNAFNVGVEKLQLTVTANTDKPTLTVTGANPAITSQTDGPGATHNSFEPGDNSDNFRNRLSGGTSIGLRVEDDDGVGDISITFAASQYNPATGGTVVANTPVTLTSTDLNTIFTRQDDRIWEGMIRQDLLVQKLSPPGTGSALPDGIYQLSITAKDTTDSTKKLILTTDGTATPVSYNPPETATFWVYVDNTIPAIPSASITTTIAGDDTIQNGAYIGTADGISAGNDGLIIKGNVSDRNGPITLKSYTITGTSEDAANRGNITWTATDYPNGTLVVTGVSAWNAANPASALVRFTPGTDLTFNRTSDANTWIADFTANIHISQNVSSDIGISLVFRDRFGYTNTVNRSFKMDKTAPEVRIAKKMETFERRTDDTSRPNMSGSDPGTANDRFSRLANGVVSFRLNVTDNLKVKEVQWWLLPYTAAPPGGTAPGVPTWGNNTTPTNGRYDYFTSEFGRTVYIDTKKTGMLDNREYVLYVLARDEAGNESAMTTDSQQPIYVLQSEDQPYIPNDTNSLKDGRVVGVQELRAVLTVNDDDGFSAAADGTGVRPGSISMEMAPDNAGSPGTWVPAGTLSTTGANPQVTRVGTSNVKLDVTLTGITAFDNLLRGGNPAPAPYVDTKYWYRITATDSYFDKYNTNEESGKPGVVADVGPTLSRQYQFELDSKPPKIKITYPPTNTTFSGNNYSSALYLEGYIWDAHLAGTGANSAPPPYYIVAKLGTATPKTFELPVNTPSATVTGAQVIPSTNWSTLPAGITPETGDTLVHFFVSAADFTAASTGINFIDNIAVPPGTNNMQFIVDDRSQKSGNDSLTFFKDLEGATWDFTTPGFDKAAMLLPQSGDTGAINNKNWWNANVIDTMPIAGVSADYAAKRTWEKSGANYRLPVVWNDGSSVPFIQGIFTDEISFIKFDSLKIKIDGGTEISITDLGLGATVSDKRSVNWRIYLTNTGTLSGTKLVDGVHSIQLYIEDVALNGTTTVEYNKMYGFRINTVLPTSLINTRPTTNVFGAPTAANAKVFGITGSVTSANLHDAVVRIRYNGDATKTSEVKALTGAETARFTNTAWRYASSTPVTNGGLLVQETYNWSFDILREDIRKARYGTGAGTDLTGNYEIIVLAEDRSEKRSPEALETGSPSPVAGTGNVWSFKIDNAAPTFTFTSVRAQTTNNTDAIRIERPPSYWLTYNATTGVPTLSSDITALSTAPEIRGSVRDTNDLRHVQIQYYKWDYSTNAWGTASAWTSLTPVTDNEYSVAWPVPWTTIADDDGYYCVQLRARDMSEIEGGATITDDLSGWPALGASTANFHGNPAYSPFVFFFVDNAPPTIDNVGTATAFTTRLAPNQLKFTVNAGDINGFGRLRVTVNRSGDRANPITALTQNINWTPAAAWPPDALGARVWSPEVTLTMLPATYGDGAFEVNFTVNDYTGKTASAMRPFTLDNTPPVGAIDEPAHKPGVTGYPFASETVVGGEPFNVKGTTDDKGPGGSASGVAGLWYRIGYGTSSATLPAVGSDNIRNWAGITAANDTNAYFDDPDSGVARPTNTGGSLWFKYEAGAVAGTGIPPGFSLPTTGINLYSWQLSAGATVPANYVTGSVLIRGTTYTGGVNGSSYLTRQITPTGDDLSGKAIYSLPLVIRVADHAGNVSYELRQIFLFPNGDNPTSKFVNPDPEVTYGTNNSFGGQFYIEGTADDNVSIRNVIYRVKVANNDNPGVPPADSGIVTMGSERWENNSEYTSMRGVWTGTTPTAWGTGDYNATSNLTDTGWYMATLESTSSKAASMPWSFMLNENKEISNRISSDGFAFGGTVKNMIRVWVEVLVFDGFELDINSAYNKMSLGSSADATKPRPYYLEFYFKESAPEILNKRISNQAGLSGSAAFDNDANYGTYGNALAENYIRSRQFAVRANLSAGTGSGAQISRVEVRIRARDTGANLTTDLPWATIYNSGTYTPNNARGAALSPSGAGLTSTTLTWKFDSTATTANFGIVRNGNWALSGGEYIIDVRISDNGNPAATATETFAIGVDNFAPFADTAKNITNTKVAGSNVAFFGRAFDYEGATNDPDPRYKGLQQVRVWFRTGVTENAGSYINISTGATQTAAPPTVTVSARGKPAYTVNWNTTNPADSNKVVSIAQNGALAAYANRNVPTGDFGHTITKAGGGTWQPTQEWDVYWSFDVDTTKFPDGWMTMYYVVEDHAGNASYYTQTMCVMNKYPRITKVTLNTNNTGEGAVFTSDGEQEYNIPEPGNNAIYYSPKDDSEVGRLTYANGYLDSGFISKNRVIGFGVETAGGNPPLRYEAAYVERYRVPMTKPNLQAMARRSGNLTDIAEADGTAVANIAVSQFLDLYTIADMGGFDENEWRNLGVAVTAKPQNGAHFVFQGISITAAADPQYDAENNIERWAGSASAYVWVYRNMRSTGQQQPANPNNDKIAATAFKFDGSGDFDVAGGGKIPEGLAKSVNNARGGTGGYLDGTVYVVIKIIDNIGGNTNVPGTNPASPFTDRDRLYDAVVLGLRVYITDHNDPWSRLYDLNPYMESAVRGGNSNDTNRARTIEAAATPGETFGANVLRGGLFNAGTAQAFIKSGYIEPKAGSIAFRPYVTIPDNDTNPYRNSALTYADGYMSGDTPSTEANDKVSGRIILRGFAWDDQLIDEIKLNIGGTATTILKLWYVLPNGNKFSTNTPTQAQITANNLTRKMMPETGVSAWSHEDLDWRTGHSVEWAYLWNTETLPAGRGTRGGPSAAVVVKAQAVDKIGARVNLEHATDGAVTVENSSRFHNQTTVDIVPYVTGLRRESPKFATTRSRQGWYSFYQSEPGIRVLGYNLGTTRGGSTGVVISGVGATDTTYDITGTIDADYLPNNQHVFTAGTASGGITVAVGTTNAWNHNAACLPDKSWNKDNFLNKETNSYTPTGSELWINKPYAHIWRTTESSTSPATYFGDNTASGGSREMESPSMALEYGTSTGIAQGTATGQMTSGYGAVPGRLHGVWAHRSTFKTFYAANDNGAAIRLQEAQDPQAYTDLAFYPSGNQGSNLTAVYVYQWDALPNLLIRTHMKNLPNGNGDNAIALNPGGTIVPFLIMRQDRGDPTDTLRWQNVRTSMAAANTGNTGADGTYYAHGDDRDDQNAAAARGVAGRVYTVGYDSVGKNVFFVERAGTTNYPTPGENGQTDSRLPLFIDGGSVTSGTRAGMWSAVDYIAGPHPVIAYYHETTDTLRLAYGTSTTNNGSAGSWNIRTDPLPSTLRKGSGTYVSMKVDTRDYIHLAFYNSVYQTVVYAVSSAAVTGTNFATVGFDAYAVDSVVTGGIWTDISVDNDNNPWIVYGDSSRKGNYDFARVAYKSTSFTRTLTDPISGNVITGWEAVTMPANYTVADDRLNIEVWPPTARGGATVSGTSSPNGSWHAAVGYAGTGTGGASSKMFRIGYFFKPTIPAGIF